MSEYLGDLLFGATVTHWFTTTAKADGAPITLAGTPAVRIYRDNSDTEDDSGITLTVDYDSKTGHHKLVVDMSADATFYAKRHDFEAFISAGTVDGVSVVGYSLCRWSVENRFVTRAVKAIAYGVCDTGCSQTSIVTSSLTPAAVDTGQYQGKVLTFDDDTASTGLRAQSTKITAMTSGGVLTVDQLSRAPAQNDSFTIS